MIELFGLGCASAVVVKLCPPLPPLSLHCVWNFGLLGIFSEMLSECWAMFSGFQDESKQFVSIY